MLSTHIFMENHASCGVRFTLTIGNISSLLNMQWWNSNSLINQSNDSASSTGSLPYFPFPNKMWQWKKWIPLSHRGGRRRNRNLFMLLQACSPCLGSLRVAGSFASVTFALSSSWQELCVAAWEKTVSPAAIGILRCQMHLGTGHPWTAKSKRGSCRVMQMHCVVQVYQLCQSALSTTASWNVCLHRGWHSGSKSWNPFFMREESR